MMRSASSIVACCLINVDGSDPLSDIRDSFPIFSRFQLARPAVVSRFLLQMIRTPPVSSASFWIWPPETASSRILRNSSTICAFLLSNDFLRTRAAFFFSVSSLFNAVLLGVLGALCLSRGLRMFSEFVSPSDSSNSRKYCSNFFSSFCGECWSIQSFVTSWLQKASTLSRYGVGCMQILPFVGDRRGPLE